MIYHHIYNRGAHKAPIFKDGSDYWRMLKLFYIANCSEPFNMSNMGEQNIFIINRKDTLINIVAYCLMPNHIHIAASTKSDLVEDPGLVKFMRKLCTGYSMYFNKKYDHSGTIWQGPYKEKIADDDLDYIRQLISYIHLNPYAIKEPEMSKEARKEHPEEAWAYSMQYEYSSLKDYLREERPRGQTPIISAEELNKWR
jgi:putative transposase